MLMPDKDKCKRHQKSRALEKKNEDDDENHVLCTFDFCEYSQRDFTAVQQRHECKERNCIQLQGLFSRKVLTRAAENEESTVWSLDGLSMINLPRPYMAISHVWSDGTGTGAWRDGEVNECLYRFFQGIATQFQCDGIWWDTLCIPKEKAARSKAIRKIQSNYENARITLVHDCFLRTWEWDPETACFAILMSPWFSRGWTALELAKSPKVKVIFKGPYGLLIKDLDEEILAKADESDGPRKRASKIIQNLRQGISSLNSLLEVLGQRHTSWPKDRAIISGLLVDVDLSTTNSRKDIWQQDVYKGILTKIRKIAPGNLFHNSSTMSKACWCPTSLFDMPTTDSKASLMVTETLDLIGTWRRISVTEIPPEKYNWRGIHALIRMQLELHLQGREKCFLLLECPASIKVVDRALLVKETRETRQSCYQYIGPVYFHPGLTEEYLAKGVDEEVTLLGDPESALEPEDAEDTCEVKKRKHKGLVSQRTDLHDAIWRGDHSRISMDINDIDLDVSDQLGQRPLHLAAERGDKEMVSRILGKSRDQTKTEVILDARCKIKQTALHRAAWGGSTACVNLLLEAGSKVDTKDKDGNLALHIAAEKGYEPVVELLINKNVEDCKAENENKVTPLHYAAASGQQKMAELLLQNGANVNAKDEYGWSPLHYAAEGGQQNIVDLLLGKGAEVNAKDDTVHWTPLHFAAMNGFDAVVRRLRQQENACSGPRDSKGWTPWRFAKLKKHDAVARLLPPGEDTDTDTDFDVLDNGRWTVLHATAIDKQHGIIKHLLDEDVSKKNNGWIILPWAAQNGQEAVVRLLLDNGAAIEAKDNAGHTLLGLAAEKGHEAVVRLLLDKGATTDAEDNNGYTPLGLAAEKGHKAVVQLLLNKGTDIEVEDNLGRTPLVLATRKGHEAVVEQLLEKGADIEAWDTNGKTPLMLAAKLGYEEVVQQLLDKGADVEAKGNDYRTPLILAADKGHEAVVRLLLDKGAAVEAKGIMSWTPLMFAAEKGHEAVVRLLLDKGAAIEATGNGYQTPLILAADKGHKAVVRLLLDKGAAIEAKSGMSWTPLMFAAEKGHEAIVRLLLDKGAATEAKNKDGHTPLILAAQKGHKAVVRLLLDKGAAAEAKDDDNHMQLLQAVPKRHEAVVQQQQLDKGAATEAKEPPWWDAVVARRGGRVAAARRGHPLLGRYSLRHADRDRVL